MRHTPQVTKNILKDCTDPFFGGRDGGDGNPDSEQNRNGIQTKKSRGVCEVNAISLVTVVHDSQSYPRRLPFGSRPLSFPVLLIKKQGDEFRSISCN